MAVQFDPVVDVILRNAISVHRALGPGLFESIYQDCLAQDLVREKRLVMREVVLPVTYKGVKSQRGFRVDLVIDNHVVLEVKSVATLLPLHDAQILTYMKLSGLPRGLLINFNVKLLKDGIRSFVN